MAFSILERLQTVARDVNRILEFLHSIATVNEADKFTSEYDDTSTSITNRLRTLTKKVESLEEKYDVILKKKEESRDG